MSRRDVTTRRAVCVAWVLVALQPTGCGGDDDAVSLLQRPLGEARVLGNGQIVLTGCPPDELIDTRETYAIDTPTGSCSTSEEVCSVRTQQWCPGGTPGPVLQWGCTCVGGAWKCTIRERGSDDCRLVMPAPEMKPCSYDPQRFKGIACEGGSPACGVVTIASCPNGSQGKTSEWGCTCQTFATLAPGAHVWVCHRGSDDGQTCGSNTCPTFTSYSVNRSRAAAGQRIELRAAARDDDGDDVSYGWTATLGRLVNPSTRNTTYTCSVAGMVTLTVKVSDGVCDASVQVEVECTP